MTTVVRPSGPLPPRVYWTRRLLLLALVVGATWGVLRYIGAPEPAGAERPAAVATTPPTTAPTPASTPTAPAEPDPVTEAGTRLVSTELSPPVSRCDPAAVRVVPTVTEPVRVAEPVPLHLRLTTTAAGPCTLDLDAGSLLVSVSAGDEPVWSSTDCTSAVPVRSLVLRPHWWSVVDVLWSAQVSGGRCEADAPIAPAGYYQVQAALLEGEPGAAEFELEPALRDTEEKDEPKRQT